jgi:hypothetical protein
MECHLCVIAVAAVQLDAYSTNPHFYFLELVYVLILTVNFRGVLGQVQVLQLSH